MTIKKKLDSGTITLSIAGRLDTITSAKLTLELENIFLEGPYNITFDLRELDYISSAGVGVILNAYQKLTSINKELKITGVNDIVHEVFRITGLTRVLDISS